MCGRARCTLNPHRVAQAPGLDPAAAAAIPTLQIDRYRPSYNVSPGGYLPVLRLRGSGSAVEEKGPVVHCMKWGLVPSFTKKTEKPDHYRMFNARSETIKEKSSFRRLLPNNRCIVAVEGFYEWKKDGSKKQPYYIHFKDDQPLVFAALYDCWESSEDRMPVILRDVGSINLWLNDSSSKHETVLRPYEEPDLVWYPVTPAMGKPSFDSPECIKEIHLKPAGEKPLSKFFAKKTVAVSEPEPEAPTSVKQEPEAPKSAKQEPSSSSIEERGTEDADNKLKPAKCIKREFEELETASEPKDEPAHGKPTTTSKKAKTTENRGDKQATLLSYFAKR